MTIKSFDRPTTEAFLRELKALASDLATKHGVIFMPARSTYDGGKLNAKLEFHIPAGTTAAPPVTPFGAPVVQTQALIQACRSFNLDPARVGPNGYRLVDYHPSKPKYPWIVVDRHGKRWKWPHDMARNGFGQLPGTAPATTQAPTPTPTQAPTTPPTLDAPLPRTGTGGTYEGQF